MVQLSTSCPTPWSDVAILVLDFFVFFSVLGSARRAIERDKPWAGDAAAVEERYRLHWRPTHERYEERTRARNRCDVVIDNTDRHQPFVIDECYPIGHWRPRTTQSPQLRVRSSAGGLSRKSKPRIL